MSLTLWEIWYGPRPLGDDRLFESPKAARIEAENAHRISYAERPLDTSYEWLSIAGVHIMYQRTPAGPVPTGFELHPERTTE